MSSDVALRYCVGPLGSDELEREEIGVGGPGAESHATACQSVAVGPGLPGLDRLTRSPRREPGDYVPFSERRGVTLIRISSATWLSRHFAGMKSFESSNVKVLRPFFTSARSGEVAASP